MNSSIYKSIATQLNFRPAVGWNFLMLAWDATLLIAARTLILSHTWYGSALAIFLIAIAAANGFGLMHEGAHRSLSSNRLMNFLIAHIGGALSALPPIPYQQGHLEHHRWAGNRKHDPVINILYTICERPGFLRNLLRVCWGIWVPLIAFVQLLFLWIYPFRYLLKAEERDVKKAFLGFLSEAVVIATWYGMAKLGGLDIFHVSAAFAFYLLLTETLSFPHHHGTKVHDVHLPPSEQHQVTRSCYFPKGISELLCLNFNFHIEHHLYPTLPWHRLRRVRPIIQEALKEQYRDCYGFSWDLENRKKDGPSAILGENRLPENKTPRAA